jgi:hypothetical protein
MFEATSKLIAACGLGGYLVAPVATIHIHDLMVASVTIRSRISISLSSPAVYKLVPGESSSTHKLHTQAVII